MRDIIKKLEELNVEKEQLNEGLGDMAHEAERIMKCRWHVPSYKSASNGHPKC